MNLHNFVKVDVICAKEQAPKHNLKDEDMYIESQWIRRNTVCAILNPNPQYYPPLTKGVIVTPFSSIPTAHEVEDLIQMFSGDE